MLAFVGEPAQGAGPLGIDGVAPPSPGRRGSRRRNMVGFVHDEHVERVAARRSRTVGLRQDFAKEPLSAHARQPRHGDDDARMESKGIGRQSVGAPVFGHARGVHDDEVQAEFLAHLVAPLQGEARRAHDDDRAGPVAQQQLFDDEPRFDGLAQADVVGQQEVGARGRECPAQGLELVGLQGGARAEGRLEGFGVGGSDGAPAHGVDEGAQGVGAVESSSRDVLRQAAIGHHRVPDFKLPDHPQFFAHAVFVEGLERDHVVEARLPVVGGAARKPLCVDVGHRPDGAPDLNHLARLWEANAPRWLHTHRDTRIRGAGESIDLLLGIVSGSPNAPNEQCGFR